MKNYELLRIASNLSVEAFVSCFQQTYPPEYFFDGEMHPFWELVYVAEGRIGVTAGERVLELGAHQVIFHKPMEFHRLWSEAGTSPRLIVTAFEANGMDMELLERGIFEVPQQQRMLLEAAAHEAEKIYDGYYRRAGEPNQRVLQMMRLYLELFLQFFVRAGRQKPQRSSAAGAKLYRSAAEYLKAQVTQRLSVEEIAEHCHTSVSNLKKVFHQYAGEGVIRYFNRLKIAEAENLIRQGYSMQEISDMLSYATQNYFTTAFKREKGIAPTHYRRLVESEWQEQEITEK
ncbi:MAG: AraC family transcriptional regulator [Clostridia bacterium]|nr:AraC family transcriptional regulator [Clostridia bacterium]